MRSRSIELSHDAAWEVYVVATVARWAVLRGIPVQLLACTEDWHYSASLRLGGSNMVFMWDYRDHAVAVGPANALAGRAHTEWFSPKLQKEYRFSGALQAALVSSGYSDADLEEVGRPRMSGRRWWQRRIPGPVTWTFDAAPLVATETWPDERDGVVAVLDDSSVVVASSAQSGKPNYLLEARRV